MSVVLCNVLLSVTVDNQSPPFKFIFPHWKNLFFLISVILPFCQYEAQSQLPHCVLCSQKLGLFQSFHSLEIWQMLISVTGSHHAGAVQRQTLNALNSTLLKSASL